jgi:hypothetical protein
VEVGIPISFKRVEVGNPISFEKVGVGIPIFREGERAHPHPLWGDGCGHPHLL